jgi:threonine synthase
MTATQIRSLSTTTSTAIAGLKCKECGAEYEAKATHVCELCFGPLEVKYDYEHLKRTVTRAKIEAGPNSIW